MFDSNRGLTRAQRAQGGGTSNFLASGAIQAGYKLRDNENMLGNQDDPGSPGEDGHQAGKRYAEDHELEQAVMDLIDPMREMDFSPVLGSLCLSVCRMLFLYGKPVLNEQDGTIDMVPLKATDYESVGHLLGEEVVKVTLDGNEVRLSDVRQIAGNLGTTHEHPSLQVEYEPTDVEAELYLKAPIKRYVTSALDLGGEDWLERLVEGSPKFRFWWHNLNYELMEELRELPMKSAMAWQALTARRFLEHDRAQVEQNALANCQAWTRARQIAGETLIRLIERQHGEGRYYSARNAEHLYRGLESITATVGHERMAAALLHTRIYADDDVKDEVGRRYPYAPLTSS